MGITVLKLLNFSLFSCSPFVRHWLSTRASNDTRESRFVKILSDEHRDRHPPPHTYRDSGRACYDRVMEKLNSYREMSKHVERSIASSRTQLAEEKRHIELQFKSAASAAAAHSIANSLVAKSLESLKMA